MIQIAVLSGKGGTGKTMLTAALATLISEPLITADADVDAANLALLLDAEVITTGSFYGMESSRIDATLCTGCGLCEDACRFDAIHEKNGVWTVDPIRCEGCAVCTMVCPTNAPRMEKIQNGDLYLSRTRYGLLSHARLNPGSGTTGLLVHEVKKQAISQADGAGILLIDGPPGIGCPLISAVSGVDVCILVAEPSVSSLHDLERLVRVCRQFGPRLYGVINKFDLSEKATGMILDWFVSEKIPLVGTIPFDDCVTEAVREGKPVTAFDCPAAQAIKTIWTQTADLEGINERM
ncbi:(4Fe-4S)-binding protein [Methanomicrobiaceae archaeon CYW5]|uniref:ATP-binding protein n=1 Tax=Methanovulcanius yangii TaxID=1789227 RepID=UPI0029CA67D1|nr:ATP-binding protein [Methanovulcanius yangii]MBT8507254.1 (4Fe-4S)-binding protein [Methanovulcanius yangii]